MNDSINRPHIVSVRELLSNRNLTIPEYQRPYKWTEKNVNQLIDDILCNTDKSSYRIGTLVIHQEKKVNGEIVDNIVDGQQRTITLTLIALALVKYGKLTDRIVNRENPIESFSPQFKLHFTNTISQFNIQHNYNVIARRINEFDERAIRYFYNKCELVKVTLADVSEAFQFFDSQNARGKDLEPHDLLKAFHLREMSHLKEDEITQAVSQWEKYKTSELSEIFAEYLYRIRNWSKGAHARYFTKDDIDCFKGISLGDGKNYPFYQLFKIANYYTDDYNRSVFSKVEGRKMQYPFQIDQCIVNGKPFFEMIAHYVDMVKRIRRKDDDTILKLIKDYEGCERTGDRYTRNMFYCGLLYYIDRFGEADLERALIKIFVWAYTLRLSMYSVGIKSIDNYALDTVEYTKSSIKLFKAIREANSPKDILNNQLDVIKQNNSTKTEKIVDKFCELKYYETIN